MILGDIYTTATIWGLIISFLGLAAVGLAAWIDVQKKIAVGTTRHNHSEKNNDQLWAAIEVVRQNQTEVVNKLVEISTDIKWIKTHHK